MPPAATADDACNVKVSDEDGYLSRCMTIKADHKAVKELSKFGSVENKSTANCRQQKKAQPRAGKKRKEQRAKLKQPCRLQDCVSACVSRPWRSVA